MMTVLLTAAVVLAVDIGSDYADGGGQGPTLFTTIEAQLAAKAQGVPPAQATPYW